MVAIGKNPTQDKNKSDSHTTESYNQKSIIAFAKPNYYLDKNVTTLTEGVVRASSKIVYYSPDPKTFRHMFISN